MYFRGELKNGIKVIMEKIPYIKSVSVGVFINVGTKDESENNNGISHFIEHMIFKGTEKRDAKDIAKEIDNLGGQMNAFTSSEYTCYYVRVLDKHLTTAVDILSDMLNNPKFSEEDIANEKRVILEEINMYLDSPEDVVFDMIHEIMFKGTPLSFPVLGTKETVKNLDRKTLIDYYNKYYRPDNMVITVIGNYNEKEIIDILNNYFSRKPSCKNIVRDKSSSLPSLKPCILGKQREFEQVNFCLGTEGIKRDNEEKYSLYIINNFFGGSVSSILFQKIREERGLAYSVYSTPVSFKNAGIFTIYAALSNKEILNVARLIKEEIIKFKKNLIGKSDLLKLKEQLKSSYILEMESTFGRMLEIGSSELLTGDALTLEEVLNKINKVSLDDIKRVTEKIFDSSKFNIAYVGNISNIEDTNAKLKEIFFS
ncbi:MAG: insulinase family protein [Tissierellia bacterium]|nr:insulinase family protein [Tissierellia bacterium]